MTCRSADPPRLSYRAASVFKGRGLKSSLTVVVLFVTAGLLALTGCGSENEAATATPLPSPTTQRAPTPPLNSELMIEIGIPDFEELEDGGYRVTFDAYNSATRSFGEVVFRVDIFDRSGTLLGSAQQTAVTMQAGEARTIAITLDDIGPSVQRVEVRVVSATP